MKKTPRQFAVALFQALEDRESHEEKTILENFVRLLAKEKKLNWSDKIAEAFKKYSCQREGIKEVEIRSFRPLPAALLEKIKEKLLETFPEQLKRAKKIILRNQQISSLIGGLVIKLDDQTWDLSLKKQLQTLKKTLTS